MREEFALSSCDLLQGAIICKTHLNFWRYFLICEGRNEQRFVVSAYKSTLTQLCFVQTTRNFMIDFFRYLSGRNLVLWVNFRWEVFFFQKSLLRYIVKQIIYGDPGGSSYCAEAMLFYDTVVSNCSRNTNNISFFVMSMYHLQRVQLFCWR